MTAQKKKGFVFSDEETDQLGSLVHLYRERVKQPHDVKDATESHLFAFFDSLGFSFSLPDGKQSVPHVSVDLLYASYVIQNRDQAFAGKKQFSRNLKKYLTRRFKDFQLAQMLKWQVPLNEYGGMGLLDVEEVSDAELYWVLWEARDPRDRVFLLRGVTAQYVVPRSALLLFHLSKRK